MEKWWVVCLSDAIINNKQTSRHLHGDGNLGGGSSESPETGKNKDRSKTGGVKSSVGGSPTADDG